MLTTTHADTYEDHAIPAADVQVDKSKLLGRGGFGEVFAGRYGNGNVAVKVPRLSEGYTEAELDGIRREIAILASLRPHTNVVTFYGFVKETNAIVMELSETGSLKDYYGEHPVLRIEDRISLALDIAEGMAFLHSRPKPIIHRDLKGANVLLSRQDGRLLAKVTDFGLAVAKSSSKSKARTSEGLAGSQLFIDPAFYHDPKLKPDARSDVFSFAVVLTELASWEGPYGYRESEFPWDWFQRCVQGADHHKHRPALDHLREDVPSAFLELITACWDPDRDRRPLFAIGAIRVVLKKILEGMSIHTEASTPSSVENAFLALDISERKAEAFIGTAGMGPRSQTSDSAMPSFGIVDSMAMDYRAGFTSEQHFERGVQFLSEEKYANARRAWKKAADDGHPEACYRLYVLHKMKKPQFSADEAIAIGYLRKAADFEHAPAMLELGRLLRDGKLVGKDNGEARETGSADDGAILETHGALEDGSHCNAKELLRTPSTDGNIDAKVSLAILYEKGTGVPQDYAIAAGLYKEAADAGNVTAALSIGRFYDEGRGVPSNLAAAMKYYQQAADAGSSEANYRLGCCCYEIEDFKRAALLFAEAAAGGEGVAKYRLASCYERGKGVSQDPRRAVELYREAALMDVNNAMYALGRCYEAGIGVVPDNKMAVNYYTAAAAVGHSGAEDRLSNLKAAEDLFEQHFESGLQHLELGNYASARKEWTAAADGHIEAQYRLYDLYTKKVLPFFTADEAIGYLRSAARLGHKLAIAELARLFSLGQIDEKDIPTVLELLMLAAKNGSTDAMLTLIKLDDPNALEDLMLAAERGTIDAMIALAAYWLGERDDAVTARKWLERAKDLGSIDAVEMLRLMSEEERVRWAKENDDLDFKFEQCKDYGKAAALAREASNAGIIEATVFLAKLYDQGTGVPQDYVVAATYYKKAADAGDATGALRIGVCYEMGRGVPADRKSAMRFFEQAAELGNSEAKRRLARCYKDDDDEEYAPDLERVAQLYAEAAEGGDVVAKYELGFSYQFGEGLPENFYKAVLYYKEAAAMGYAKAMYALGRCYEDGTGVTLDLEKAAEEFAKAAAAGHGGAESKLSDQKFIKHRELFKSPVCLRNLFPKTKYAAKYANAANVMKVVAAELFPKSLALIQTYLGRFLPKS
ncbi:hypothetical protein HK101_010570 [Irineochytrium annulatum]|nr:hypothetical protein HK101_010570 [Irineochytrium annulatum]